jgi:hypothetical protein
MDGPPLTQDEAKALRRSEVERERRERRALRERARRRAQATDVERLAQVFREGRAIRPLLGASRFMSRRGLKVLRDLALAGDLSALRIMSDMVKTLALLEFSVREREAKERGVELERPFRQVTAVWPNESEKC